MVQGRTGEGEGEGGEALHCRLEVPVRLGMRDGTVVSTRALVDTGSKVNLVRRGLVDE